MYWDPSKECHFLIGTTGEPIAVPDVKQIWELVASAKNDTATKVCLSVYLILSIDAHNSLYIIPAQNLVLANSFAWDFTAAKAILNSLKADELYRYSRDLIEGLIAWKIKIISYANDGTEVEWAVQKQLIEFADSYFTYKIKHPIPGYADLVIVIAIINGQLVAMIQDSKHGLKTD